MHSIASAHGMKFHSSSNDWKTEELNPDKSQLYFSWKDRVNYSILKDHHYEIIENPDRESAKNSRIYICKYEGCNKTFTKTWNLVYHFRLHTKEKPFECKNCNKKFSQKCNLSRHIKVSKCSQINPL